MIHIGSFDIKTEIFVLIVSLILMSVQLLLCFKVKKLWIRLIPLGLFVIPAAVLVFISLFDEYHRIILWIYALYLGIMAFMCVCGWAIWWIVDSLVTFLKNSSKKQIITLFSVLGSVILVVATAFGLFHYTYPTSYPYKDREIIGSTPEEVIEEYGAFSKYDYDEEKQSGFAAYMIRKKTDPSLDNSLWYEIHFRDGVAVSVRLQRGWHGG